MTSKSRLFLGAFAVSLILDQLTKRWIIATLDFSSRITVIEDFFYLTHVRNPGAAFSLFATAPAEVREPFFIVVTLIAIGLILSFLRKLSPGEKLSAFALGLILGGAVGNLIDRIEHHEVVDFLHIRLWSGYSWPDFNLADSFIVVGVALLVIELFVNEGEAIAAPPGSGSESAAGVPARD